MTPPTDTLIHVTDLHFWEVVWNPLALMNKRLLGNANVLYRRRHEFHMAEAMPFAGHLASLGIRECFVGGDFTSTATHGEYKMGQAFVEDLTRRGMRVQLVPGNHDVYTFESVRSGRFAQYFGAYMPPGGYPSRSTLPGGTPLILVPTVCPNWLSSAGYVTDEEAAATRALIDACPPGPVLVGGHYPLLHRTATYASGRSRQLRNARALRTALGGSGRQILYVAGHVHRFSYTRDPDYPGLQHLTTGAFFLRRPGDIIGGAFSTIAIEPGGFAVHAHEYTGAWKSRPLHPVDAPPGRV